MELMMNLTSYSSANVTVSSFWEIGILEICMLSFGFMTGLPTHSYVIWLIVSGTENGITSEFFNLNLCVCEIIFSVNSLLILITHWCASTLLEITQFFFGVIVTGRPLFQCLISVERYLAVVHPVTFLKLKPLRYRVICSAVVWTYIFATCLFCMFSFIALTNFVYVWFYSVQFLLFFFIQMFCLVAVIRTLKQPGPGDRRREAENHIKRRAFLIIRVTSISLVITYVPFIATGLFSVSSAQSIQILWSLGYICFVLAAFVQPGLFLHRTGTLLLFCKRK